MSQDRGVPPLDELYREVILDHYRRPRGRTPLPRVDVTAHGHNPLCGDEIDVALALADGHIEAARVTGHGCAICTASGSIMAELLPGRSTAQAKEAAEALRRMMHGEPPAPGLDLGDAELLEGVQRFPVRVKCALLPWMTLRDALAAHHAGVAPALTSTEEITP